jgi:predicted nucleic acid-binding protein
VIALDNMVLAWGVRGIATVGQEENVDRAQAFLEKIEQQGTVLAVPTPALAEFLVDVPVARHLHVVTSLRAGFVLLDFDANAAARAAEVMAKNLDRVRSEHGPGTPGLRQALKTDAMILGVCLARSVRKIVSDDGPLKLMAQGFPELEVVTLPDPPLQRTMFGRTTTG